MVAIQRTGARLLNFFKKMNQMRFVTVVLVVIIIVLIGTVGYFAFLKKSEPFVPQSTPSTTTQLPTPQQPSPTPADETANWKTYVDTKYGLEFKYPQDLNFQTLADASYVQAEIKSGLPDEPHIDSVQVIVDIDKTKLSEKSCMPDVYSGSPSPQSPDVAKHVQIGNNLFYKYYSPDEIGCGGFQCGGGDLYRIWHNDTCYFLESRYQSDYLEKIFSCSSPGANSLSDSCYNASDYPKYVAAKQSQQAATEFVNDLVQKILSTFKFTK
jgi:hypothetical protein